MKIASILLCVAFCRISWADVITLVSDPWCPYACLPDNDRPGFMIEIANAVFKPLGHQVDYQIRPFARAVLEVEQGLANGLVGEQKVKERAAFHFPENEQGAARACFFTLNNSTWQYSDASSLAHRRFGVIDGYVYGEEIDQALRQTGHEVDVNNGDQALLSNIRKLELARLDAVVEYEAVMSYTLNSLKRKPLRSAGCAQQSSLIYIPFSPFKADSIDYARQLSNGMETLRRNGQLDLILARYGLVDWQRKSR